MHSRAARLSPSLSESSTASTTVPRRSATETSNAVELSDRLGESRAARECTVQQVAAYAVGERLAPDDACTVGELAKRFEASDGDLRKLLKDVATWPGLRTRRQVQP